jgi:hypothetical protein
MSRVSAVAACFTVMGVAVASLEPALPATPDPGPRGQKSDFGIPSTPDPGPRGLKSDYGLVPAPTLRGPVAEPGDVATPDPTMPPRPQGRRTAEELDIADLTVDAAKRAIDAFAEVRDKYNDAGMENYQSLEEFVAETESGKRLEAEIMEFGFSGIGEWNETIMLVGIAYSAFVYDYAADLRQQIREIRDDPTIDDDMRAQLIAGLNALLPSTTNRIVMQELFNDQDYRDKLRLLEEEE